MIRGRKQFVEWIGYSQASLKFLRPASLALFFTSLLTCIFSLSLFSQTIDPSFTPQFSSRGQGFALKIQNDERILVSGIFQSVSGHHTTHMGRMYSNGEKDTSFTYDQRIKERPSDIAVQKDNKIIIAGNFHDNNGHYLGSILRLHNNGSIDESFNISFDSTFTFYKLHVLPNQKIVGLYLKENVKAIELFHPNGMIDQQFETVAFDKTAEIASINHQSNNSILVAGTNLEIDPINSGILKIDSTGIIDKIFNLNVLTNQTISLSSVYNFDVLPDKSIGILSGNKMAATILDSIGNTISNHLLSSAYTGITGSQKGSFVLVGQEVTQIFPDGFGFTTSIGVNFLVFGIQAVSDGIVATGLFGESEGDLVAGIIKYNVDEPYPTRDRTFSGRLLNHGNVYSIAEQENEKIIVGGSFSYVNGERFNHLARLNANGSVDTTFYSNPADLPTSVSQVEVLSDQSIVILGRSGELFLLEKDGKSIESLRTANNRDRDAQYPYLSKDSNNRIYVGDKLAYSQNGNSGQGLSRYAFSIPIENPIVYNIEDYNNLYINSLFQFNGILTDSLDRMLLYGKDLVYDNSDTSCIIRALEAGEQDLSFKTNLPSHYHARHAITLSSNEIIISGYSEDTNSVKQWEVYKLNENGKIDTSFTTSFGTINNNNYDIHGLKLLNKNRILVFGDFDKYSGSEVPTSRIVLDNKGQMLNEFLPELSSNIFNDIVLIDSTSYYIGGRFSDTTGTTGLAKINHPCIAVVNNIAEINVEARVLLEGAYDLTLNKMSTVLNQQGYLPGQNPQTFLGQATQPGQPYQGTPWNYSGIEGIDFNHEIDSTGDYAGYTENITDYILISLRTEAFPSSEVCKKAVLLKEDGTISSFSNTERFVVDTTQLYYVVIEHRNHLPIMSKEKMKVRNNKIVCDFTSENSYRVFFGQGQKRLPNGVFAMFAGNIEQSKLYSSSNINVFDSYMLLRSLGIHSSYLIEDLNLDGDVNSKDRSLLLTNNGVYSDVKIN